MSLVIVSIAGVILLLGCIGIVLLRRRPAKLNATEFRSKWQSAQSLCAKQDTWPLAVINADKLLDDALKKRKYKGKTMGERMVAAQHDIKANDNMWFGHKLRNKLVHEDLTKLKKKDVITALVGFREALKDLGALK